MAMKQGTGYGKGSSGKTPKGFKPGGKKLPTGGKKGSGKSK